MATAASILRTAMLDFQLAPLFIISSSSRQKSRAHHSAPRYSRTLSLLGRAACSPSRFQISDLQSCSSGHRRHLLLSFVVRADGNGDGGGVNAADAEGGQEEKNGLTALQQLDSQLRVLSQTDEARSSSRTSYLNGRPEKIQLVTDSSTPTAWPEFSEGFLAYAGVGLLILTVINNVLYRVFLEPPIKPKVSQTISSELRMLRIRKLSAKVSGNFDAPPVASNSK